MTIRRSTGNLRQYATGHLALQGKLSSDIYHAYPKMILFGDYEWVPSAASGVGSALRIQAAGGANYHSKVCTTRPT